jgi:hypothetical protein
MPLGFVTGVLDSQDPAALQLAGRTHRPQRLRVLLLTLVAVRARSLEAILEDGAACWLGS